MGTESVHRLIEHLKVENSSPCNINLPLNNKFKNINLRHNNNNITNQDININRHYRIHQQTFPNPKQLRENINKSNINFNKNCDKTQLKTFKDAKIKNNNLKLRNSFKQQQTSDTNKSIQSNHQINSFEKPINSMQQCINEFRLKKLIFIK